MSQWQVERQIEREEEQLARDLEEGLITNEEYNRQMRELQREYRAAADEAAWDAYERERDQW